MSDSDEAKWSQATLDARKHAARDVVFLIPGLLGFENFTTFSYFEDRVAAALRAALEQVWQEPTAIVPVPIPPTASLRVRQRMLLETMADRLEVLEQNHCFSHVHLIGHSTGGVDANLLTDASALDDVPWSELDPRGPGLLERIRSVISIASPHQGACITEDPIALLFRRHDLRGLRDVASLVWALLGSLRKDGAFVDSAVGAARSGPDFWRFVTGLWERWELLDDLAPSRSLRLRRARRDVVRRSFVTVAGRRSAGATTPPADGFFLGLSERASGTLSGCASQGERVAASVQRLNTALESRGGLVIKADHVELPRPIDAEANDGVVNSARQLFDPSDAEELAGIVVGDHFDVVGYYDRHAWLLDGNGELRFEQVLSGLLHSGSGFRDDQFFELYGRVADAVAGSRK